MKSWQFSLCIIFLVSVLSLAQVGRRRTDNQSPAVMQVKAPKSNYGTRTITTTEPKSIHPQQPGLSFAQAVSYNSGGWSPEIVRPAAVSDVNQDGYPDILVANNCPPGCGGGGVVGVLLGNGDGTFRTAVGYDSGGNQATSLAAADVNGDGKADVIVANYCDTPNSCESGSVSVLLGNGDGTFQTAVPYNSGGSGANAVAVADVNRDGISDIVVINYSGSATDSNGSVGVLLGNGDGTFQTAVSYDSGGVQGTAIAVADVNGDGNPDLLVANCSLPGPGCSNNGEVSVLLGNGDGTFAPAVAYGSGGTIATAVSVSDVNGDGKPDLLIANQCINSTNCPVGSVGVLLGNGDGTFQMAVSYASGGIDTFSVAVGDVNGDGKTDIELENDCVTSQSCGTGGVSVLLGNGDGTFQTAVNYSSGGWLGNSVATIDVNGDGKPDLVAINACNSQNCSPNVSVVGVLINTSIAPTTTQLVSSQNPSSFGDAVTFTATVVNQGFGHPPTGVVSFLDSGTNIGNSNVNGSGVATLTTSTLTVGTHTITATYNGDANFAPSTSSPLFQVVQGAIAVLSPMGLNFGNQTVGIPSSPQPATLQNTGNINLNITSIQITGQNGADFSEKNNCPSSLPPNNSCQISVTFKPTTTGTRNAAVSVSDNAPNSPQSVSLTGVGVLPAVMLSPSSLTFPTTVVYTTSAPQKLTLTNTGQGILEIMRAKISPQFGVTTNCGKTLQPGASCTANVKFKPTMKGQINGSITVTDNAPDSPQQVPLSGTGTFVQLSPTSLNFGNQPVNTTSPPKYITLENQGTAPVNFTGSGITIGGADPGDFAEQNNCPSSLPSGSFCKIKVTFKPTQQGKRTANVSVSDDGGGSPQLVPLAGTGTP